MNLEQFTNFWRDHADAFVEQVCADILSRRDLSASAQEREPLISSMENYAQAWLASLEAADSTTLTEFMHNHTMQRIPQGMDVNDMMHVSDIIRTNMWRIMGQFYAAGDWDMDVVEQIERWLHETRKAIMLGYSQTFQEASKRLADRERALEDQSRLIQELSAPIVPIYEGILVLPLVGTIDSRRAAQIMESALEKIVSYQADVLILDITGVPIVDTGVANYILQMARAVTLLGSRVVLVGIGAEIAQTIVQLGVDLRDMTTLANLQAGISYALAQQGFAITAADTPDRL